MTIRIPIFIENFLINKGFQNAILEGEKFVETGLEIFEQGGKAYINIFNFKAFFKFLIKRR
jgi:hypothetical protein